jgi:hypothetical protein
VRRRARGRLGRLGRPGRLGQLGRVFVHRPLRRWGWRQFQFDSPPVLSVSKNRLSCAIHIISQSFQILSANTHETIYTSLHGVSATAAPEVLSVSMN